MPDIVHDFPIQAAPQRVFEAISTPAGLDMWWTKQSSGASRAGGEFVLGFGPDYDWRARVTRFQEPTDFELRIETADRDWAGTRVGFRLVPQGTGTLVQFCHAGWPEANEHWRVSCYCWAMYLRILRRHLEHGEVVPYEERLSV